MVSVISEVRLVDATNGLKGRRGAGLYWEGDKYRGRMSLLSQPLRNKNYQRLQG
jgi:hypothetical protein